MALKVKAVERLLKFDKESAGKYRYVMKPKMYSTLTQAKVISKPNLSILVPTASKRLPPYLRHESEGNKKRLGESQSVARPLFLACGESGHLARIVVFAILLQHGNFDGEGIGQVTGNLMGTEGIVVCIVLTTLGKGGMLAWLIPHMKAFGAFYAHGLLQVVGDAVGIHKMAMHATGNIARSHDIEAVGIDKGVCIEIATHHGVHHDGDASLFARFADKTSQIIVESETWVCMTVGLGFLVVVAKLNDDIVAWTNE